MNMIDYINAENCRSVIIGNYFGDAEIINCDICDNCTEKKLQNKRELLIPEIIEMILAGINNDPKDLETLIMLVEEDKKSVVQAIDFLAKEQKIKIHQDGRIGLK
jgi:ATP-dependent DNA helicase RecQ